MDPTRQLVISAMLMTLMVLPSPGAVADTCHVTVGTSPNAITSRATCTRTPMAQQPAATSLRARAFKAKPTPCPPGLTVYTRWVKTRAGWASAPKVLCLTGPPKNSTARPPTVTAAMVLAAFRRVSLPRPRAVTQPGRRTLVNFDTIFYVNQGSLTRSVQLLGQRVTLRIRPQQFTWRHGDGTVAATRTPGAAYPAKQITYRYRDAGVTVRTSVDITWGATYRVNSGPWRAVRGTVTTRGPGSALRIVEAVPALYGD